MSMFRNVKDLITDTIGFVIMIITLVGVWHNDIQWQWEGVIGLCVGFIFFWMPDDIILKYIKRRLDKDL
jgi:hypothetical protein